MLTLARHAAPVMWLRGWDMLSPVVQKLIGAAASAVCALAGAAVIGGVIMYGDVRAMHQRFDGQDQRLEMLERRVQTLQGDVTMTNMRLTEHQRSHGRQE